ncbi:hypothetical protein [Flavobacterium praedii]|uniref:hypothetical protein n=1 Tax=Flavobacterium praedii TaxID=3002900 RepID=UPI002481ED76|nr:hypothetical protein [Flavobacterium praedii]
MDEEIQNKLNKYCIINRKYHLLDEKQFLSMFSNIKIEHLKKAWEYSFVEIQNKEIITSYVELQKNRKKEFSNRLRKFNFNSSDLYFYLNSEFDVKELLFDDEHFERRIRNALAKRHQIIIKTEIKKLKRQEKLREIKDKIISTIAITFIPILIFALLFVSRIRDGFTSVDILTERIYEREIYEFDGSICRDGKISHSQGRGTCSWHNGVYRKFHKGQHKKSKKESRIEAQERSWIE